MPIYEYICRKGHEFEEMQSFSAPPKRKCPVCGTKAERRISLTSFVLKGSGWYSKDSAPSAAKTESTKKPAETKEEKPKVEKKDPAPEPKKERKTA